MRTLLGTSALAVVLAAGVAVAQQQQAPDSAQPSVQQQTPQQPTPQPEQLDRANKQAPRVIDTPNTAESKSDTGPAQQQQTTGQQLAPEQKADSTNTKQGTAPSRPTGDAVDLQGGQGTPKPSQSIGPPNAQEPLRGEGFNVPGASAQTVPAKFSTEKADLAEYSIMGYPLQLNDQQRSAIWKSLAERDMTESARGKTVHEEAGVFLPPLVQGQEFPSGLTGEIPELRGMKYVKVEDKVLIVQPANGIVRGVVEK